MKKHFALLLCVLLLCALCACSSKTETVAQQATQAPAQEGAIVPIIGDATSAPTEAPTQAPTPEPAPTDVSAESTGESAEQNTPDTEVTGENTEDNGGFGTDLETDENDGDNGGFATDLEPDVDVQTAISVQNVQYLTVSNNAFGFFVNYPSDWINLPGRYTVCYRENTTDKVPARFTVTKKTLVHTPKSSRILREFQDFGEIIKKEYDEDTFEWEEMNESATFIGQPAYEITYMAYVGKIEIQGYMICAAIDKDVYIYHFYCPYEKYDAMRSIRTTVRDSVYVPTADVPAA